MLQALKRLLPWKTAEPSKETSDWAWTKDTYIIEQYATQLLFVPDNMKMGGKYHGVLKDVMWDHHPKVPHNDKVYTHNKFFAYKQDLGEFSNLLVMPPDYKPSGFIRESAPEAAKIQGELYSVNSFKLYLLDKFKQNGVQFVRTRVRITYPFREVRASKDRPLPEISPHCFKTVTAWMYVGKPSYWDSRIGGVFAQPLKTFEHTPPRPWIGEFYKFDV